MPVTLASEVMFTIGQCCQTEMFEFLAAEMVAANAFIEVATTQLNP